MNQVGGFPEAIKILRQQIIKDFREGVVRFDQCFKKDTASLNVSSFNKEKDANKNPLYNALAYLKGVKDLISYDKLYGDLALGGEEILHVETRSDSSYKSTELNIDLEQEFYEPIRQGTINQAA